MERSLYVLSSVAAVVVFLFCLSHLFVQKNLTIVNVSIRVFVGDVFASRVSGLIDF